MFRSDIGWVQPTHQRPDMKWVAWYQPVHIGQGLPLLQNKYKIKGYNCKLNIKYKQENAEER